MNASELFRGEFIPNKILKPELLDFAKNGDNVLMIGDPGSGKTLSAIQVARSLDLKFAYYSAPTVDPYSEFVGIPALTHFETEDSNGVRKIISETDRRMEYFRTSNIMDAEFIFVDEINRMTNEKLANTFLELLQFGSINGKKLPNLKLVWAAVNPESNTVTAVNTLDEALKDRFHQYVWFDSTPDWDLYAEKYDIQLVTPTREWYKNLEDGHKNLLSPRRIGYIIKSLQSYGTAISSVSPEYASLRLAIKKLDDSVKNHNKKPQEQLLRDGVTDEELTSMIELSPKELSHSKYKIKFQKLGIHTDTFWREKIIKIKLDEYSSDLLDNILSMGDFALSEYRQLPLVFLVALKELTNNETIVKIIESKSKVK